MKKAARTQLTEERKRRGWSQQELADRLGTTQHNVSRWEAGHTTPGPYFRAKICELFGKTAQELGITEQYNGTMISDKKMRRLKVEGEEGCRSSESPILLSLRPKW